MDIPVHRTGVLYVLDTDINEKVPTYVVEEQYYDRNDRYYRVYGVFKKNGKAYPIKDYKEVPKPDKQDELRGTSNLVKLAKRMFKGSKKKPQILKAEKPPLFMAPGMNGVDTFTGQKCFGFKEYSPDKYLQGNYIEGQPTGVFLNIDLIRWGDAKIDIDDIINNVTGASADGIEI